MVFAEVLVEGSEWTLLCLKDEHGRCPVVDFMREFRRTGHPDLRKLLKRIEMIADTPYMKNEQKFRSLGGGIHEIKAGGLRVACFFSGERTIVCAHGFLKPNPKRLQVEIALASKLREEYFRDREN